MMVTMGMMGMIVMMWMIGMMVMMWMMGMMVMIVTQVTAPRQPRRTPGQQQLFRG